MNPILKNMVGVLAMGLLTSCACRTHVADGPRAMFGGQDQSIAAAEGVQMNSIYYAFDRYDLTESSKATLRRNAEWLKENNSIDITIEGHADERGTNSYNMALGQSRAQAAAGYLRSLGIEADRITTVSFGEERPADPSHNEEAWTKNRRAEFKIVGLGAESL